MRLSLIEKQGILTEGSEVCLNEEPAETYRTPELYDDVTVAVQPVITIDS